MAYQKLLDGISARQIEAELQPGRKRVVTPAQARRNKHSKRVQYVKLDIFMRDDWTCVYCASRKGPFRVDHRIPISRDGGSEKSNLATACAPCDKAKGNLTDVEFTSVPRQARLPNGKVRP